MKNCIYYTFIYFFYFLSVVYSIFTITAEILACALANFLLSISGQTHEFIIYAMRQRARAGNLTICYRKKQIDVSFQCVLLLTIGDFRFEYEYEIECEFDFLILVCEIDVVSLPRLNERKRRLNFRLSNLNVPNEFRHNIVKAVCGFTTTLTMQ